MDTTQMLLIFVPLIAVTFFMQSRSNKKKQAERTSQLESIKIGTNISTIGGFFGEVTEIGDDYYIIRLVPGESRAKIVKDALRTVITGDDELEVEFEVRDEIDEDEDEVIIEIDGEELEEGK